MTPASVIMPAATIAAARADLQRLNSELVELHKEEQRCQLQRSRLEADRARVLAFIDTCELAQRYSAPAQSGNGLAVQITPVDETKPNGAKLVVVSGASVDRSANLTDPETPSLRELVVMAIEDAVSRGRRGLKPSAVIDFVLQQSPPGLSRSTVSSAMWRMTQDGQIEKRGSRYRLNGSMGNSHAAL
jgi:hypothetical protein